MNDDAAHVLEMSRHFEAKPERVFDAWLGTSWGDWLGPRSIRAEVTLIEPKIGGRYSVTMHRPDGTTLTVHGEYREIDRPNKLVFSWKWDQEGIDTLVSLTFRASGGGTDMTIRHSGFASAERRDNHNIGWTGSFDKLAEILSKEKA